MSLASRLKKSSKSEYAQVLSESDDFKISEWITTGNYALNILICGDPHRGFPAGRFLQLAGPNSVGKSFISLELVLKAQKQGYFIVYYDTEFAQDKESLEARGLDLDRLLYVPIDTVEALATSMLNIVNEIEKNEKVLIVIDSVGNLSTVKEVEDTQQANDKRDMTRAQKLRALFRTVTLKAGLKQVPVILVNHVSAAIGGYGSPTSIGGGGGSLYASTTILELFKSQEKDGDEIIGSGVTCKSIKNRLAKEKRKVRIVIDFNKGIDPYSGLLDLAEESGVLKKGSTGRYEHQGKKLTKKQANSPEVLKWVLEQPEFIEWVGKNFKYQQLENELVSDDVDVISDEETIEEA